MGKRKKRAATSLVSEKAAAGETRHHLKTGKTAKHRATLKRRTTEERRTSAKRRRLRSADRPLLNADHPRNAA